MVDYIDRNELLAALRKIKDEVTSDETVTYVLDRMINTVSQIPAADAGAAAKGRWLKKKDFGCVSCSECGELYPYADYVLAWRYCPNCGASIR